MSRPNVVLSLIAFGVLAAAQTAPTKPVQHAAQSVARLRDATPDPASFVLEVAFITKPIDRYPEKTTRSKRTYCYAFRFRNSKGGSSEGRAWEDPLDHGRLTIVDPGTDGVFLGYDAGWFAPCTASNLDEDITPQVAEAAPALYGKSLSRVSGQSRASGTMLLPELSQR